MIRTPAYRPLPPRRTWARAVDVADRPPEPPMTGKLAGTASSARHPRPTIGANCCGRPLYTSDSNEHPSPVLPSIKSRAITRTSARPFHKTGLSMRGTTSLGLLKELSSSSCRSTSPPRERPESGLISRRYRGVLIFTVHRPSERHSWSTLRRRILLMDARLPRCEASTERSARRTLSSGWTGCRQRLTSSPGRGRSLTAGLLSGSRRCRINCPTRAFRSARAKSGSCQACWLSRPIDPGLTWRCDDPAFRSSNVSDRCSPTSG
jgi:hypothetical protein